MPARHGWLWGASTIVWAYRLTEAKSCMEIYGFYFTFHCFPFIFIDKQAILSSHLSVPLL